MGDQVIALEHKADGVVPVGIPVLVSVFFCGDPVDDQISGIVAVQSPDDIQKRGLAGAAGAEDRHKFAVAEIQAHVVQRFLYELSGPVFLADVFDLKH